MLLIIWKQNSVQVEFHYKSGDTVMIYDPVTGEITNSELLDDELDLMLNNLIGRLLQRISIRPF